MIVRILVLFQTFLVFDVLTEVVAANHRCYVCIPNTGSSISDVLQMFPEGTVIPLCNQFDTDKSEFVRECPWPKYQGCLTQTNGLSFSCPPSSRQPARASFACSNRQFPHRSHVTKTCTELAIEDCKTANKIKYCYCKDDLCNKESVPTEAPLPPEISTDDDEDSPSEGSGSPEGSDSRQLETSSESDLGIEVIRKKLPTTTKSVILTTPRPDSPVQAKATAGHLALPVNLLCVVSFLLVLRVNFN